jgi:hypothetical protein
MIAARPSWGSAGPDYRSLDLELPANWDDGPLDGSRAVTGKIVNASRRMLKERLYAIIF